MIPAAGLSSTSSNYKSYNKNNVLKTIISIGTVV